MQTSDLPANYNNATDKITNQIVADIAGGNTGIFKGGIQKTEEGVLLNANTHGVIDAGNPSELNLGNKMTLKTWIKTTNFVYNMVVLSKGYYATTKSYMLQFIGSTYLGFYSYGTGFNNSFQWNHGGAWKHGEWNHVAVVIDGNTGKLYVNGEVKASSTTVGTIPLVPYHFYIGAQSDDVLMGDYFSGYVRDVLVWNKPLSPDEIKKEMQTQTLSGKEEDLVGYLNFK